MPERGTPPVPKSGARMIHLPAVVAGEFGIPLSDTRRLIALGRVKVNGHVCTDLDLDPDVLSDQSVIELESRPLSDALVRMLQAQQKILVWCPACHDGPFASGPCMNCGGAIDPPSSPTSEQS